MIKNYIKLLRVKHYFKNILIFFPLVFGGQLFVRQVLWKVIIGMSAFSFAASAIYIINDINDMENDRKHATKCRRPLASGVIPLRNAEAAVSVLFVLTLLLNWSVARDNWQVWIVLFSYIGSNLIYSFGAKRIALLDVFILVIGLYSAPILRRITERHSCFKLALPDRFIYGVFLRLWKTQERVAKSR